MELDSVIGANEAVTVGLERGGGGGGGGRCLCRNDHLLLLDSFCPTNKPSIARLVLSYKQTFLL